MNKLFSLIKINLLGMLRGKEERKKGKAILRALLIIYLVAIFCYYSYRFASLSMKAYQPLHLEYILLIEYFAFISIFLIFSNYKKINNLFFKSKDHDMLSSLPIKNTYIVVSKLVEIYVTALLITLIMLLPAYIIYVSSVPTTFMFNLLYFITIFFIPVIPVVASVLVGYIISYITSLLRFKELGEYLINGVLIVLLLYVSNKTNTMNTSDYFTLGKSMVNFFNHYYPLTKMYKQAVFDGNIFTLLVFIISSVLLFIALVIGVSKSFNYIHGRLNQVRKSKNKKIKETKSVSPTKALLKKDYKKLFSSVNYSLNSCMGVVFLVGISILMLTRNGVTDILIKELSKSSGRFVFPYLMIMFIGYVYPVCVSLSMEGKSFYILRTLPIKFKSIIKEKIIFSTSLLIMPIALTVMVGSIKLDYTVSFIILITVTYILSAILFSLVHLFSDIIFIKLNWTSEVKLVKQSIQTLIAIGFSVLASLIPVSYIKNQFAVFIYIGILVLLIIILLMVLNNVGNKKFEKTCN